MVTLVRDANMGHAITEPALDIAVAEAHLQSEAVRAHAPDVPIVIRDHVVNSLQTSLIRAGEGLLVISVTERDYREW